MKFELETSILCLDHFPEGQMNKGTPLSVGRDLMAAEPKIIHPHKVLDELGKFKYVPVCELNSLPENNKEEVLSSIEGGFTSFYIEEDNEGKEIIYRKKYDAQLVKTGFCIKPESSLAWFAIYPRSSLIKIGGITLGNNVGVIDPDYCGPEDEVYLNLISYTDESYFINVGERLAQLIAMPYVNLYPINNIDKERDWEAENRGGFGSTGGIF